MNADAGCRRRASLLLAIALTASVIASAAMTHPASASTRRPTLAGAKSGNAAVKLSWKFTTSRSRTNLRLLIDRKAGSSSWAAWTTVDRPGPQGSRTDAHPRLGTSYYRVRLYDKRTLVGTSAGVRVVRPTTTTTTTTVAPVGTGACATARANILTLVNEQRSAQRLGALHAHGQLDASAQVHSDTMAGTGVMTHDHWIEEIRAAGYAGGSIGQNVAYGYPSAASVMDAWMSSPGHRANILNGTYRDLGVGCTRDGHGTYWWTQNFGA